MIDVEVVPGLEFGQVGRDPVEVGEDLTDEGFTFGSTTDAAAGGAGLAPLLVEVGVFSGAEFIDPGGEDADP